MLYLVTGGAGFIGSNIVQELLKQGHDVRVLDNFATSKRETLRRHLESPRFRLIEGDLRSYHTVSRAVHGVDFILHQGALPSVPRSIDDPITSNDVNILGTLNILEAAKAYNVKRVVYASSSSVYGNSEKLPKEESMPIAPLSPYAITKYAAERYCEVFYRIYGIETVSLRYFNVFGPNQDPSSQYSAVIPKFITAIAAGKRPVIFGDGMQSRDFTFVYNNVTANLLACTAPNAAGKVINIACGERFTLLDLVSTINRILGKSVEPEFQPARAGDVLHSMASIEQAREILGFTPQVGFMEGLERTVAHFIDAGKC
jgi:nucleoside-diphosphate-sugar epimerase